MQTVLTIVGGIAGFMIGGAPGAKWGMTIGAIVGGYIYPPSSGVTSQKIAGLSITAPQKGQVLQIVYGRTRINGNIIWYGDFHSHETDSGSSGGGGKGGGQETYRVGFAVALAEGKVGQLLNMWAGGDEVDLLDITYTFHGGSAGQVPDGYIAGIIAANPADGQTSIAYPYVCYIVVDSWNLGYSSALPNFTFEVKRTTADVVSGNAAITTLGLNGFVEDANGDMNPVVCLADLMTHPRYGLGLSAAELDATSWQQIATWAAANGLFCSPVLDSAQSGLSHIEHLLSYFDGILLFSQGIFKLRSRRSPALSDLDFYPVDWRDWLAQPKFSRSSDRQMPNSVALEYADRSNNYDTAILERTDDWDVGVRGMFRDQISLPGVTTAIVADRLTSKWLWAKVVTPFTVEMRIGPQGAWYEPGDLISVEGSELYALDGTRLRIITIQEEPNGEFTLTAVEER